MVWGSSPGLARTCVLNGGRLSLVLAKLTGCPFAMRTGAFYHFTYMLQLRWVSFQDVCSPVRRWGAHMAFGLLTQRSAHSPEVLLRSSDEYVSNFFSTGWNFQQKHFHLLWSALEKLEAVPWFTDGELRINNRLRYQVLSYILYLLWLPLACFLCAERCAEPLTYCF